MKKSFFTIVVLLTFVLSITSCGGGSSAPSSASDSKGFALGEYVAIMQNAVNLDKQMKAELENLKDSKDLEKLIAQAQAELEKYKEAVNTATEQDMGKEVALDIAEGAPFVLETPLKFGKTLPYSDAIWVMLEGEIGLNGEVTLPEGKENLIANLVVVDKEGNNLYTKNNFATFKGAKNETGTTVIAPETKAKVGEYIIIKEKAIEDWSKADKMVLVVAE